MRRSLLCVCAFAALALALATVTVNGSSDSSSLFDGAESVSADPPSATSKAFLHQSGINFVQTMVNSIIRSDLTNLAFPDMTVKAPGGHIYITSMVLKDVAFTSQQVGLVAPNQVTVDLTNIAGEIDLDWKYKGPLGVHDHGTGTNKFSGTSLATQFTFASDASGRPAIHLDSLNVHISDLSVHIGGGGGWLMNFLVKLFKNTLIKTIESKISATATTSFNGLFATLQAKYPLVLELTGKMLAGTEMNLGLVPSTATANDRVNDAPAEAFQVAGDYLVASGEWSFQSTTNTTLDPRPHDWIPNTLPLNAAGAAPMFGFSLDEAFLGTLLYSLTQNGMLDIHLDNQLVPAHSFLHLNTKLLALEYPTLYAAYPNNNITVDITQFNSEPPMATTSTAGTRWTNAVSLMLNVVDPTKAEPIVPVCQLRIDYELDTIFQIIDNSTSALLTGKISPLVFTAQVIWADLNPAHFASSVQGLVTTIVDKVLVPLLDTVLAKGIPLPPTIAPLLMKNLFVAYANHSMAIGFDLALPSTDAVDEAAQTIREWQKE